MEKTMEKPKKLPKSKEESPTDRELRYQLNLIQYRKGMKLLDEAGRAKLNHWLGLYDDIEDSTTKIEKIKKKYVQKNNSIYLIKCGIYHKIGYALSPKIRKDTLQIGNPYEISLVYSLEYSEVETLERKLHKLYKDKKVRGEWFKLGENDIENIKGFIEIYVNNETEKST